MNTREFSCPGAICADSTRPAARRAGKRDTGSVVQSIGDLTLRTGLDSQYRGTGSGNITTQGADLLAGQAITLSGNAIDPQAVANETTSHSIAKSKSFVIGAAPVGAIGSQIATISDHVERTRTTDNSRQQAASTLKAGYDTYKLVTDQKTTAVGESGFSAGISVGGVRCESAAPTHPYRDPGIEPQKHDI